MSVKSLQGRRTENTLLVLSYTMPILHQPRLKLRTKCVVAGVKHKSPKQCWNLGDQSHRLSLSLLGASSADIGSRSTSQSNTCDEYDSSQKPITYYHPTLTPNCYNTPIAPTHKRKS